MWANQAGGWPAWPGQQSTAAYTNSSGEVDWAALAKQWIARKEAAGNDEDMQNQGPGPGPGPGFGGQNGQGMSQPPPMDGHGHPPLPPPPHAGPPPPGPPPSQDMFNQAPGGPQGEMGQGWGWGNQWGVQNWNVPPPDAEPKDGPPEFFGGNQNFNQQFEYNQGRNDQYYEQEYEGDHGGYGQYWDQPPMPPGPGSGPPPPHGRGHFNQNRHMRGQSPPIPPPPEDPALMNSGLDASKRRLLPAWIREGLEKMEREKQKKLEKERLEKERLEAKKAQELAEKEAAEAGDQDGSNGEPKIPAKSRFDSDDEGSPSDEEDGKDKPPKGTTEEPRKAQPEREQSPEEEPPMTEEEKTARLMLKVRQWMTEVLLEVTNQEVESVAQEVYYRGKKKKVPTATLR